MSFYSELPLDELAEIIAKNPGEIDLRLALIERYVDDGDLDDALVQACLAEELETENPEVLAWKSLCMIFRGELEQGHRLLQTVIRRTPSSDFQDKLIRKVFPAFTAGKDVDPEDFSSPWSLFGCTGFEVEGRYGEMIESMTSVGRLMADQPEVAVRELSDHIKNFPEDLNAKLYMASVHLMNHEIDQAESLYRDVIEQDPECSTAYFDLAVVVEDSFESIELLRHGLSLFPQQDIARYNLGTFLLNSGEVVEARRELLRIPGDSTHYADALIAIGVTYESEEGIEEAAAYFEKVAILQPERSDVQAKYGQLLLDLDKYPEALVAFNVATELDPKSFCGWHNKGIIYVQFDEDDLAINAFRNALDIRPDSAWSAINMAVLLRDQGHLKHAIDALLEVYQHNPTDVTLLQNLGAYYSYSKDYEQALKFTQLAIAQDDQRPLLYWNMADSYAKLSDRENCLKFLAIAINQDVDLAERFMSDSDFEAYWWDPDFKSLVDSSRPQL